MASNPEHPAFLPILLAASKKKRSCLILSILFPRTCVQVQRCPRFHHSELTKQTLHFTLVSLTFRIRLRLKSWQSWKSRNTNRTFNSHVIAWSYISLTFHFSGVCCSKIYKIRIHFAGSKHLFIYIYGPGI